MVVPREHEVYAAFGVAAMAAQLFEQNVLLLLRMRGQREDVAKVIELSQPYSPGNLGRLAGLTLGRLVGLLKDRFELPEEVAGEFSDALAARNRLMHGYFARNTQRLQSLAGKAEMVEELDAETDRFYSAVNTIGDFVFLEGEALMAEFDGLLTSKQV